MSTSLPTMPPLSTSAPDVSDATGDRGRVFVWVFGVVAVLVTLGAIVLAASAPMFTSGPPAPGTWTKVVDGDLNAQSSVVSSSPACQLGDHGLDVTGEQDHHTQCDVTLSSSLANGFLLTVNLAPDTQIANGVQQPYIALGDSAFVAVDQPSTDSTIVACTASCGNQETTNEQDVASDAWHNDNFYANTLTLYWPGRGQQLVVYANGQEVLSIDFAPSGDNLALGALAQGEALYTHLTVYTP